MGADSPRLVVRVTILCRSAASVAPDHAKFAEDSKECRPVTLSTFNDGGDSLADADTHGGQAELVPSQFQLMRES